MTRRRVGLALIGVVLVFVAVVAELRPHLQGGSAQPVPVPAPPSVGDCVLDPYPSTTVQPSPDPEKAGGTLPVYPPQTFATCTGARYGEVVTVFDRPLPYSVKGDDDTGRYLQDPNLDACSPLLNAYLGMPDQPADGWWYPDLQVTGGLSRPSPRQQAAGQRWAACVVAVRPPDANADPSSGPRYGGTIRNALTTGAQRNLLGACLSVVDWSATPSAGGCGLPHSMELFGYGSTGDRTVSRAQLASTCRELVGRLTGMPDPTAAGLLAVQVHIDDGDGAVVTTPQVAADSFLRCGVIVIGNRKLGGSLRALGRAPLPWV